MKFLTPKEAAERLAVSPKHVYTLCDKRVIASHKIGRSVRISEEDFAAYLASVRTATHAPGDQR